MKSIPVESFILEVSDCYSDCPQSLELYDDYAGADLEYVKKDMQMKLNSYGDHDCFLVKKDEDLVGYYALGKLDGVNCLITFFVRPDFRNKEDILSYWNLIKKQLNYQDFIAGVFTSNMPACSFLKKNGQELLINETISYYLVEGE